MDLETEYVISFLIFGEHSHNSPLVLQRLENSYLAGWHCSHTALEIPSSSFFYIWFSWSYIHINSVIFILNDLIGFSNCFENISSYPKYFITFKWLNTIIITWLSKEFSYFAIQKKIVSFHCNFREFPSWAFTIIVFCFLIGIPQAFENIYGKNGRKIKIRLEEDKKNNMEGWLEGRNEI